MKRFWAAFLILPLCATLYAAPAASKKDAKQVKAVVQGTIQSVLGILQDKDLKGDARKKKVEAIVTQVFDLNRMGKLVLGRKQWGKLSKPQKGKYSKLFVRTIQDSYYEKIDLFTNETVDFEKPEPSKKGKYKMLTRINSKGERYDLLYKLYKSKKAWRIYDVEIEGISLVRSYGSQYGQFLQKNSFDNLLKKMTEKTFGSPKDLKEAKPKKKAAKKKSKKG